MLKDKIRKIKKSIKAVADFLTFNALEIKGVKKNENSFDGIIVGEILEISKHPNADKLQLTKVNVGKKVLDIVCGAYNIKVGDKVPVALVGTKLPASSTGGLSVSAQGGSAISREIKEVEIRGAKSVGMLCAQDELGLGSDHSGIMILNEKTKIGMKFTEYIKFK